MRPFLKLALALMLGLGACSLPTVDKESDGEARKLFEEIRTGADLRADADVGDELKSADRLAELAAVTKQLPSGPPTKVENRGFNFNTTTDGSLATLTHAYVWPGRTVFAETVLRKGPGETRWKIVGMHITFDGPPTGDRPPVTVDVAPKQQT